jgi:light-regulated signal transduction histidine kinase (bacteriophytochrome)
VDEKRIAERVASSVTAGISWTGSTYDDADKAGALVQEMGRDLQKVVAMVIKAANLLEDDFNDYDDNEYKRFAANLQRDVKKAGDVAEKALGGMQLQLRELKGQVDHLSDLM